MEKELLAVYKGLENSEKNILGYRITVETDNINLRKIGGNKQRAQRWKVALSDYDLSFVHVKGKENAAADFLSREPLFIGLKIRLYGK